MYIKNAAELVANGQTDAEREAREFCLDALEAALKAVRPASLIKTKVRTTHDRRFLVAGSKRFDLRGFRRIFVIGGGKASAGMAEGIEEVLGDRITRGIISVLESQVGTTRCRVIKLRGATHPLPSANAERGVRDMIGLVGDAAEDVLVICLLSGGGSAMLPLPKEGVTLSDKAETTRILLRAGANVGEMNVVRKHLSDFKGGWLAARLWPATVLSLVVSDVVGDRLDLIASGPVYPDPSTFHDAVEVLKKYDVLSEVPSNVVKLLVKGSAGLVPDTPKPGSKCFRRVTNVIVGNNEDACTAAARRLRTLRCRPRLLTTGFEGEARTVGRNLGSEVLNAVGMTRPRSWVVGGETTVTVRGNGSGGRNQELVLGAAVKISGNPGVAIASIGTDGTDGPTDAAGAIVDGYTTKRARALGLLPQEHLRRNDSYSLFSEVGDLLITGPTGTNVNDVCIVMMR